MLPTKAELEAKVLLAAQAESDLLKASNPLAILQAMAVAVQPEPRMRDARNEYRYLDNDPGAAKKKRRANARRKQQRESRRRNRR